MPMKPYEGASNKALTKLAEARAAEAFEATYEASEAETVGLIIAGHFNWDGIGILETFASALEDANFHDEAGTVTRWLARYLGEANHDEHAQTVQGNGPCGPTV